MQTNTRAARWIADQRPGGEPGRGPAPRRRAGMRTGTQAASRDADRQPGGEMEAARVVGEVGTDVAW